MDRRPRCRLLGESGPRALFGTVGPDMLIERASADSGLLAVPPEDVVRQPLLRLIDPDSAADALAALARSLAERRGICTLVQAMTSRGSEPAQLFVVPLSPDRRMLFSLAFSREDQLLLAAEQAPEHTLITVFDGLNALTGSAVLAALDRARLPGWNTLTSREADIVARVLAGDRGPSIARRLHLSESTVRNTLSAAYRKLQVKSQQELVDLFRKTAKRLADRYETSS